VQNKYLLEAEPEPLKGRMHEPLPQEISDQSEQQDPFGRAPRQQKAQKGQTQKGQSQSAQPQKGPRVPQVQRESDSAYRQLLISLERLVDTIRSSKGLSSRDLDRFADQIDTISDEMERE